MVRIQPATRESVPEDQREAFDQFVQQSGSIPTTGPLSVMIHASGKCWPGASIYVHI